MLAGAAGLAHSQRGFSGTAVLRARTLATALRITRLVGIPALLLVGVALARGQSLAWALVTAPAVAIYAAALAIPSLLRYDAKRERPASTCGDPGPRDW